MQYQEEDQRYVQVVGQVAGNVVKIPVTVGYPFQWVHGPFVPRACQRRIPRRRRACRTAREAESGPWVRS